MVASGFYNEVPARDAVDKTSSAGSRSRAASGSSSQGSAEARPVRVEVQPCSLSVTFARSGVSPALSLATTCPASYQPPVQQYRAAARPTARRRHGSGYGAWTAVAAVVLAAVAGGAFYVLHGRSSSAPGSTTAQSSQPETEAGVRSAATQFYALYSASQWAQAWQMLAPASQRAVPESLFVAVHPGCPSSTAGLARAIRSVAMAGSTAVVTEGLAGAASALGSVTDTWDYADGRWGVALAQSSLKDYSHGSASADVAAMKAAGLCAS